MKLVWSRACNGPRPSKFIQIWSCLSAGQTGLISKTRLGQSFIMMTKSGRSVWSGPDWGRAASKCKWVPVWPMRPCMAELIQSGPSRPRAGLTSEVSLPLGRGAERIDRGPCAQFVRPDRATSVGSAQIWSTLTRFRQPVRRGPIPGLLEARQAFDPRPRAIKIYYTSLRLARIWAATNLATADSCACGAAFPYLSRNDSVFSAMSRVVSCDRSCTLL